MIKDIIYNKETRDGFKLWLLFYVVGLALCAFPVNFITAYILYILQLPLGLFSWMVCGEWMIHYGMPDVWIVMYLLWFFWTILWLYEGIKDYNKHKPKR